MRRVQCSIEHSHELSSRLYRRRSRLDVALRADNGVRPRFGTNFPWGTVLINITGSTVMGLIAGYLAFKGEASQPWRLFIMTGVLGGYTTFSAFSLDAGLLYERGEIGLALAYVAGSVLLAIAGLFAGLAIVRSFG